MPDAPGDGGGTGDDGSHPGLGMFVTWHASPALPGMITDKITVSQATFQLDHFEVVGDAGVDARTRHSKYLLSWDSGTKPGQESFPQAPVGVYSKINLVMMTGSLSENVYEIRGTWTDTGMPPREFRIRDRGPPLSVSVDCDETLPAAGMASLALRLDLSDALNGINFKAIADDDDDDEIEIRDGPQLAMFRSRLKNAFGVDDD